MNAITTLALTRLILLTIGALSVGIEAVIEGSHGQRPEPPLRSPFQARVIGVLDGDTLTVQTLDGTSYRVRLEGIDAPETGQPLSEVSRNFARVLSFGKEVSVRIVTTDRNGRLVSRLIVDGRDLSVELVRAGLAWHFTDFSDDAALAGTESDARIARRGLWSEPSPVAPWKWRSRGFRAKAPEQSAVGGDVRGNVRSRVYHASTCQNFRCQNCTAPFKSVKEAESAGYRAAGDCIRGRR